MPGARTSAGSRRDRCRSSGVWPRRFDRMGPAIDRRRFIKTAAGVFAAAGGLAAPAIGQRAQARVLRFVPQGDLANFDPIWNTQYVVRNAAALGGAMLYGLADKLQPRRQMVSMEGESSTGVACT